MPDRLTVFAPQGMLGYGIPERSMRLGVARQPDVIAVDAGSIDPGPYYLGAGTSFTNRRAVRHDLSMILDAAHAHAIPVLIGSAGGAGGDVHLDWLIDIYHDICRERGYTFRTARISAEIDRRWLKQRLESGGVAPLDCDRVLTSADIDNATRIVGQMGFEPFMAAIDAGAQVVIAGRAFDPAMMGAHALMQGFDRGLVVHMGKLLECGGAAAYPRHGSDGLLGTIERDSFTVEPPNPDKVCTIQSVAAHSLYERADPYHMHFPGGAIDLTESRFEQASPRAVRISGTRYIAAQRYTIKLEGAAQAGFRTIAIAGVRDPILIAQLDAYIANVRTRVAERYPDGYELHVHVYGRDGVMGSLEPHKATQSHELGLLFDVIAPDPETSAAVLALTRSVALHVTYPGRKGIAGNLAFPFSPSDIQTGAVYTFNIHHLVTIDDPCEPFRMDLIDN
ncbi:MAG TPA: acyclic terpene utilization AtuA family protein [Vineibacter sp.]|nr:acyclic terpene utilization AtuA family protein [Vineibacter sp.]